MIFFPGKSEILIFPYSKEQVQRKLQQELTLSKDNPSQLFIGWIEGDKFKITKKLKRPDNFSPLMSGEIDASSKDSLVFIRYRLMFSTKMFLTFWTVVLLFLTVFFMVKYEAFLYGTVAFIMCIINYLIVYLNFKKQVHISHDLFINVFKRSS